MFLLLRVVKNQFEFFYPDFAREKLKQIHAGLFLILLDHLKSE